MPIYELQNGEQQVRFLPGHDGKVTIFTYDGRDDRKGTNKTLPLKVARSYWCGLVSVGYREVK